MQQATVGKKRRGLIERSLLLLLWGLAAACVVASVIVLTVKFYLVPNLDQFREQIEAVVVESSGQPLTFEEIEASWSGLNPVFRLSNVRLRDESIENNFSFSELYVEISSLSLLKGEVELLAFRFLKPEILVVRNRGGGLSIAGIKVFPHAEVGDNHLIDWFLRQKKVEVIDGTIVWVDESRGATSLRLSHLLITSEFYNGAVNIKAVTRSPGDWYQYVGISLSIDDLASAERISSAAGALAWDLRDVDVSQIYSLSLASADMSAGSLSTKGTVRRNEALSYSGFGDLTVAKLNIVSSDAALGSTIERISSDFRFESQEGQTDLTLNQLSLHPKDGEVMELASTNVRIDSVSGKRRVSTRDASLDLIKAASHHLLVSERARDALGSVLPGGMINVLEVSWHYNPDTGVSDEFVIQAGFEKFGLYASKNSPGFRGLSGMAHIQSDQFLIDLSSTDFSLEASNLFSHPVVLDTLSAQVVGKRTDGDWDVEVRRGAFGNKDIKGSLVADLKNSNSKDSQLSLTLKVDEVDYQRAPFYFPARLSKLGAWFADKVHSGKMKNMEVKVVGQVSRFPFRDGGGSIEFSGQIENGRLELGGGWPGISQIDGDLVYANRRVTFDPKRAQINGVSVANSRLIIDGFEQANPMVQITGQTTSPLANLLDYVRSSPLEITTRGVFGRMNGDGAAVLKLSLVKPLKAKSKVSVSGALKAVGSTLMLNDKTPAFNNFDIGLQFTERNIEIVSGTAQILGGVAAFYSEKSERGLGEIKFDATNSVNDVMNYLGLEFARDHVDGMVTSSGSLKVDSNRLNLVFVSDLIDVKSTLPQPLRKIKDDNLELSVTYLSVKNGSSRLSVRSGVDPVLTISASEGHFDGVAIGSAAFVDGQISIGGEFDYIDVDQWRALIQQTGARQAGGAMNLPFFVDAKFKKFQLLGAEFHDSVMRGYFRNGEGIVSVDGPNASGSIGYVANEEAKKITANFERLVIKRPRVEKSNTFSHYSRSYLPPAIDAVIDDLQIDGTDRGSVTLKGRPSDGKWRIDQLINVVSDATLSANGDWSFESGEPVVNYDVDLRVSDVGAYLKRIENSDSIVGGNGNIKGTVSWNGNPFALNVDSLHGELFVLAQDGKFGKMKPGVGNLIGLLSLQSLPRRITLDFRDVFSSGFSFDTVSSKVIIRDGIAFTDAFTMKGPAAKVLMSGSVNLRRKEQALDVYITPDLSSVAAVAGAVAVAPVVGVATFIAQKVLGDPFDKIATRHYEVLGTWSAPEVRRRRWTDSN